MRRGRIIIYLALLIILILVVVFLFRQGFLGGGKPVAQQTLPTPTPVDTVDVVVATQHVGRGQILEEAVLDLVPYQRDRFIEGMLTSVDQAMGRRARIDLESGYILFDSMLTETTEQLSATGSDAALLIPRGMVSVSIPINRLSSVSFAPQRGDHVSVIVTLMFVDLDSEFQSRLPNSSAAVLGQGNSVLVGPGQVADQPGNLSSSEQIRTLGAQVVTGSNASPMGRAQVDPAYEQTFYLVPSEQQRPRLVSQTLIRDVIVLQVGNFALQTAAKPTVPVVVQPGEPTPTPGPVIEEVVPPPPDVITLIVSPQDAVTLNYLVFAGAKLTLALRGTGDDTNTPTEAVTLQYLLSQYNIPVPVKLPYGIEPRIDELIFPTLPNDKPTPTPTP